MVKKKVWANLKGNFKRGQERGIKFGHRQRGALYRNWGAKKKLICVENTRRGNKAPGKEI